MLWRERQLFLTEMMPSRGQSARSTSFARAQSLAADSVAKAEDYRFCNSGIGVGVTDFCCSGRTTERFAGASGWAPKSQT